jgi:phosphate/phosphite/phosphonate ABC transporter binding protein
MGGFRVPLAMMRHSEVRLVGVGETGRSRRASLCFLALTACTDPVQQGTIALGEPSPSSIGPVRELPAPAPADLPDDGVLHVAYAPVATELDDASWQPLRDHLVRRLGVLIEPVPYDTYGEIVEAVARREVDLALLAPLSYVLACEAEPGLEPLVQTLSEGKTSYSAYLFVDRSSPYHSVAELEGARIAFVDERSTSGFLLPYADLLDHGIDPEKDLADYRFVGDHVGVLRALALGEVDAAASYADAISWAGEYAAREGWELPPLRLLGNTGRIPLDVLVASPALASSLRTALREELLRTNTSMAAGRQFFASSRRIVGWAEASDEAYDGVRRIREVVREHREAPR